jgi:uncharacterized membrane protein YhdT
MNACTQDGQANQSELPLFKHWFELRHFKSPFIFIVLL